MCSGRVHHDMAAFDFTRKYYHMMKLWTAFATKTKPFGKPVYPASGRLHGHHAARFKSAQLARSAITACKPNVVMLDTPENQYLFTLVEKYMTHKCSIKCATSPCGFPKQVQHQTCINLSTNRYVIQRDAFSPTVAPYVPQILLAIPGHVNALPVTETFSVHYLTKYQT